MNRREFLMSALTAGTALTVGTTVSRASTLLDEGRTPSRNPPPRGNWQSYRLVISHGPTQEVLRVLGDSVRLLIAGGAVLSLQRATPPRRVDVLTSCASMERLRKKIFSLEVNALPSLQLGQSCQAFRHGGTRFMVANVGPEIYQYGLLVRNLGERLRLAHDSLWYDVSQGRLHDPDAAMENRMTLAGKGPADPDENFSLALRSFQDADRYGVEMSPELETFCQRVLREKTDATETAGTIVAALVESLSEAEPGEELGRMREVLASPLVDSSVRRLWGIRMARVLETDRALSRISANEGPRMIAALLATGSDQRQERLCDLAFYYLQAGQIPRYYGALLEAQRLAMTA